VIEKGLIRAGRYKKLVAIHTNELAPCSTLLKIIALFEPNSVLGCEFMNVLNGECRILNLQLALRWSIRIVWSR